jgi:pyruvate/2-oxoacid:ferredoxin oxidoreductase beta subunit
MAAANTTQLSAISASSPKRAHPADHQADQHRAAAHAAHQQTEALRTGAELALRDHRQQRHSAEPAAL